jgi:dephospho-CoA kinase
VNPVDRSIDRKILGKKVFQSSDELKKLTDIVWPAILSLAQARIDHLFLKEGNKMNSVMLL